MTNKLITIEYGLLTLLVALLFMQAGFDWWWLLILFIVFDISMVGYFFSPKLGSISYNIGHSAIGPALLLIVYLVNGQQWELFVSLLWLFHIFADRALGYGLKYSDSFHHTHLGNIHKATEPKKGK